MEKNKKAPSTNPNPYIPFFGKLTKVTDESHVTKRFLIELPKGHEKVDFIPGQFFQLSVPGVGEVPISLSDYIQEKKSLLFCIANTGVVTNKIHQMKVGEFLGVRGPYGNGFPMEKFKGKNLIIVAGGIGLFPLRSVIEYYFRNKNDFEKLEILYGAKNQGEIIFREEMKSWRLKQDTTCKITIDKPEKGWDGNTGFVCNLVDCKYSDSSEILFHCDVTDRENTVVLIVGPPVMFNSILEKLKEIDFPDDSVYLSLENHMKCGIGKCGHCNCGSKYVCQDGPIFTWKELKTMEKEY